MDELAPLGNRRVDDSARARAGEPAHSAAVVKKAWFVRRQSQKKRSLKVHPERNAQFERITELKAQYLAAGQPVVSIDIKKKEEMLGNFYREGKLHTRQTIEVLDHDFPSYSEGKIVPHWVYDSG